MQNKWYSVIKGIVGPFLRVYNRPKLVGGDNIPEHGAAIMASNHQSVADSFFFPLICDRQLTFPAKSEYFTGTGVVGAAQRWFFTAVGQVPVERTSEEAGAKMLEAAQTVLDRGDLFGIYPEGTRSPDGRIYRGRTGMARIAMATGQQVIPVGMVGSRDANPIGSWVLRPKKVEVRIGKPIDPHAWAHENGYDISDHETARAFTDHVMHELARLTGYPYVDVYASDVKKSLEAGEGYPEGARPGDEMYFH